MIMLRKSQISASPIEAIQGQTLKLDLSHQSHGLLRMRVSYRVDNELVFD